MLSKNTKDTLILGVIFTIATLITMYFEPIVLVNPFTPVVLSVFYLTLIISHFTETIKTKEV